MQSAHTINCETCHVSCADETQISDYLREAFLEGHSGTSHHVTETGKIDA